MKLGKNAVLPSRRKSDGRLPALLFMSAEVAELADLLENTEEPMVPP